MKDRVADVLIARRALDRRSPAGLAASLVLHALVVLAIVISARNASEKPMRPVLTMQLIPANAPRMTAPSGRPDSARTKTPKAKVPAKPTPPVAATAETAPKAKRVVEKALFGKAEEKSRKPVALPGTALAKPDERSLNDDGAGTATDEGVFGLPAVGQSGVTGLDTEFPYPAYIERMLSLVGRHWYRPQSPGEPIAQMYFVIGRDGVLRDIRIEKSSGNRLFDRAAQRALAESSPLPPLPLAFQGRDLGVHLTFH